MLEDAPGPPIFVLAAGGTSTDLLVDALGAADEAGRLVPIGAGERSARSVALLAERAPEARFVFLAAAAEQSAPPELEAIDGQRVLRVDRDQLVADPAGELRRVCAFAGLRYDQAMLTPVEAAGRGGSPASRYALSGGLGGYEAAPTPSSPAPSPYASGFTPSFAEAVAASDGSLLISTYQTHRLVCVRVNQGELNTHFRGFEKPMGIAVAPGRIALGTNTEIWDLRDVPAAATTVDPPGPYDGCYLTRNRHVTGDIAVHELAFVGGQLWVVATAFSCLATLDADHSFVPRWAPPFITRLAAEDRCHLNGMATNSERVTHVTTLGLTDEPRGWRAAQAAGGALIDVASSEPAITGLSMPHSPRWHGGRLWLLESGRGTLAVADLEAGRVETVAELPGFTRGLAFIGDTAFVGLSQIRERSTFGELPVTRRLDERQCGVWMVDLRSGAISGLLRFEDLVQEIFDVALLPGRRYPEIAEPGDDVVAHNYVLP